MAASFEPRTLASISRRGLHVAVTLATLLVMVGLGVSTAHAQSGYTSTRAMGMGGAWAGGPSNGALFVNPAGMMATSTYSGEFGYHFNGPATRHGLGLSMVDSNTNPNIAAGVAYNFTFGPGENDGKDDNPRDHDVRFALAAPLVPNLVFLGVGGHYTSVRTVTTRTIPPPIGLPAEPEVVTEADRVGAMTIDVGLMAVFKRMISIGISAQNIAQPGNIQEGRRYTGGIGLFIGPVHAEAQYAVQQRRDNQEYEGAFSAGAEVTIANLIPIRAGVTTRGITDAIWVTGGLGYRSPYTGVEVGYQQSTAEASDLAVMGTVSIYR